MWMTLAFLLRFLISYLKTSSLLSFPKPSVPENPSILPPSQPRSVLKDRLFVGNLHPTVDELGYYTSDFYQY